MRTKSGQNGLKPGQNSGYVRNRARRTSFCTVLMPEGQLWPFLRMRNSKIRQKIAEGNAAKTWSIRQKFMSKRKQVMYNFASKVVD